MPKRTDSTQREVVDALRRCGVFVFSLHTVGKGCPDLLLSYKRRWYLAEVKNGKLGWKSTPAQRKFRASADASVLILTSATDAVTWASNVNKQHEEFHEKHPLTERCGFDRNASHSEDRYVCECGWREG